MTSRPDLAALFAASPYPYLLIDTGFVIIGANPAYCRATGRTGDDLVGKHIFDAFPANASDPGSTNLDEVRVSIELAIATKRPHTSALLRYAVPHETPGGTVFDERFWSAVHTPVFDAAGEVIFVSQNAIDVTDVYRFDAAGKKYYLRQAADAVADVPQMNQPQMHEAMRRILDAERGQMQILFDQAPGFIAVLTGAEHTFEMVNDAFYELVGHRELLGKPALQALPELAGQGLDELLGTVSDSARQVVLRSQKMVLQRNAGAPPEDHYVDLLYQPIIGEDGRVTGVFVQGNDVTAAYRANQSLSEKVEQLEEVKWRQAFQLELTDRIRATSSPEEVMGAVCELLGRTLAASRVLYAEVNGDDETFRIRRDWTAPGFPSLAGQTKTLRDFGPELVAALRAGEIVANQDVTRDRRTASHAGAYRQVGVGASLLVPLVRAGKLQVVLTVQSAAPRVWREQEIRLAQETGERTWSAVEAAQAQAALRAERDQSQTIFDSMAEGFAMIDRDWTILRMNAEGLRLMQLAPADVIGHNHWDVFPLLKGTDTEAAFRRVMEGGKTEIVDIAHTLPDGTPSWTETRAHKTADGGIAFFFRNVTERRLAQEQLELADRRKDEFLAMLAHELRNPLAPIGAAAQLLQTARLDEGRVRETSKIIGRQVRHMTHLINDLLDVSRVTRGLVELEMEPVDIRQIALDAVEQVTPLMQARRHRLDLQLPPESTTVRGDKERLVQVFTNLLNNAAKYTDEGGHVRLSTEVHEAQVRIKVSDNGIGMTADLSRHAFDLFSQAERSSDRSAGGLGLGLALVKNLVELHGGAVTCASAGIGKGSSFTVCLPRMVAQDAAAAAPVEALDTPGAGLLRIIVVDDNVDAAAMLAMLLEAAGHHVAVEHGSRRALERAHEETFDAFLLDIGLPDMDGAELAGCLRARAATAGALLVAVTGYGQAEDRKRTLAAGFDHHLVKPVDLRELDAILHGIAGSG